MKKVRAVYGMMVSRRIMDTRLVVTRPRKCVFQGLHGIAVKACGQGLLTVSGPGESRFLCRSLFSIRAFLTLIGLSRLEIF